MDNFKASVNKEMFLQSEEKDAEIKELHSHIDKLLNFVSACRYAGPDGLDDLKEDASRLYKEYTRETILVKRG
jgi:hypothetical protein